MINREDFKVVSLSAYTSPTITEVKNENVVEYGSDNDYFNYLIKRITGSPTNGAIIKGISNLIYGKGIEATNSEGRMSEYLKIKKYFRPNDLRKIIYDRKALGMAAIQVLYKDGEVVGTEHFPMQTLRPEKKDDKGKINNWLYFNDWKNKKKSDKATPIAAYGCGSGKESEIYIWQGYVSGFEYFVPPEYIASLPYAVLEEEIGNFLINDTKNGFSPSMIVNFNNGIPEDQDKRRELADEATKKLSSATGKKILIDFSDDKEHQTTFNAIPLDNAPEHYEYLSKECFEKLIIGHGVTSPMLLGIRDGQGGLSSNADEIKNATLLFENIVIRVFQNQLVDIIDEICPTTLDLYFKTIQPLDFMQVDEPLSDEEEEKQTGVDLSKQEPTDQELNEAFEQLKDLGEDVDNDYELVDEREVDEDTEDEMDYLLEEANYKSLTSLQKAINLVKTGTARPNIKSEDDRTIDGFNFKVRYKYSPETTGSDSREFCKKMVSANKIYRKEDLVSMGSKAVNSGFGIKGAATYSIFKYKGGPNCNHKFMRLTFKKKGSIDVKSPLAPRISTNKAEREGYRIRNPKEVAMKPKDMPNKGYKR